MQSGVKLALRALGLYQQPIALRAAPLVGKKRCLICPHTVDRKTNARCSQCGNPCCQEHSNIVCELCRDNE